MDDLVTNRIAIIPARGGSKRLPGKNILDFYGKPMIAWTIEAAINTNLFDKVLVSTDSNEIADISKVFGADVPFLRNNNTDDFSTVSDATITALNQLKDFDGSSYKTVVQLMANCPLRTVENIINQVTHFEEQEVKNSLLSGFHYGMFNPWWAHSKNEKGNFERLLKDVQLNTRSQDLPELLCPSGATWISTAETLLSTGTFYSPEYKFYTINWKDAVDIDDTDDLDLAKVVYLIKNEKNL
jgi:N-acylneuraminate cytidylyltransferase